MKVKDLKKILKKYSDDTFVYITNWEYISLDLLTKEDLYFYKRKYTDKKIPKW